MHVRLLAVGDRHPAWVDAAFETYAQRFPPEWKFRLELVPTAGRRGRSARAVEEEGHAVLKRLSPGERTILLDERGRQLDSRGLARELEAWQQDGHDLAFLIGGPDGVSAACRDAASFAWSLSKLTLPHGLARVLVAEQLYRASSLLKGHPYHRE